MVVTGSVGRSAKKFDGQPSYQKATPRVHERPLWQRYGAADSCTSVVHAPRDPREGMYGTDASVSASFGGLAHAREDSLKDFIS